MFDWHICKMPSSWTWGQSKHYLKCEFYSLDHSYFQKAHNRLRYIEIRLFNNFYGNRISHTFKMCGKILHRGHPFSTYARTCEYHWVRNVGFPEYFAFVCQFWNRNYLWMKSVWARFDLLQNLGWIGVVLQGSSDKFFGTFRCILGQPMI